MKVVSFVWLRQWAAVLGQDIAGVRISEVGVGVFHCSGAGAIVSVV